MNGRLDSGLDSNFYVAFGKVLYISNSYKKKGNCRVENKFMRICLIVCITILLICLALSPIEVCRENKVVIEEQPKNTSNGGLMDSAWPMKCHDQRHTSQSPYSTEDNPGWEKWRFRTQWDGAIESSSVIDNNGTIYFGSMGSDRRLYALYPNMTKKWSYQTGGLIWSTPALAEDGTIYVGSWDHKLHALFPNGTRKWRFNADDAISSSPAIGNDGTIYFGCNNKKIFAVNPNGTEKWQYRTDDIVFSNPAIGDDGTIYVGSCDSGLYAMNPNGTLKWRFDTGDEIHGHPSIDDNGIIYISSWDSYLYAIYPNGTLKWKTNTNYGTSGSAAITNDGTIYLFSDKLRAFYPNNGTIKWSLDLGGYGGHTSPALSADGTIYVCNCEGKYIFAIDPGGFVKWQYQISNLRAESSPIIAEDGTIYVGSSWEDENTHLWYGYFFAIGVDNFTADAHGPYYGIANVPVQFTGSAYKGVKPYEWLWDFGDGNTSTEQNATHIYRHAGNYTVILTVTDSEDNITNDTTWAKIQATNDPPSKPEIDGRTHGEPHQTYPYTFVSTDPDDNDVFYYIDWGDDTNTGWIGPFDSGEEITRSHKWDEEGTYTISAKAKDIFDEVSEWGYLEIEIPVENFFLKNSKQEIHDIYVMDESHGQCSIKTPIGVFPIEGKATQ